MRSGTNSSSRVTNNGTGVVKTSSINEIIEATIVEFLSGGVAVTSREISDRIIDVHRDTVLKYGEVLAEQALRRNVSERMKKTVRVSADQQSELPFDMNDIPTAISFVEESETEKSEVQYLGITWARKSHVESHIKLLDSQIAADSKRLEKIRQLYRALEPIWESHDVTVGEALRMLAGVQEVATL